MTTALDQTRLAIETARLFSSPEGRRVLHHLRSMSRDRVLGPDASDAQLRHVEGQRALVAHIENLIERGCRPVIQSATPSNEGNNNHG